MWQVPVSLQASILGGMVEIEGSAKYLKDHKMDTHTARVSFIYQSLTHVKELTMPLMVNRNPVYEQFVKKRSTATHVVTRILYGVGTTFVFETEKRTNKEVQHIEADLKLSINGFPGK